MRHPGPSFRVKLVVPYTVRDFPVTSRKDVDVGCVFLAKDGWTIDLEAPVSRIAWVERFETYSVA